MHPPPSPSSKAHIHRYQQHEQSLLLPFHDKRSFHSMSDVFPKAGVKIKYVTGEFVEILGGIGVIKGLTTEQVCHQKIKPLTLQSKSSYCDMLKKQGHPAYVEKTDVFISHAHSYLFEDFLSALKWKLREEPEAGVWLDMFSINQHQPMDWTFEWLSTTFKSNVAEIGRTIMVMSPWDNPLPYTRSWCVFEAYCTAEAGGKFEIAMGKNDEKIFLKDIREDAHGRINQMLATISAEKSECSVASDRESIFAVIEDTVGFFKLDSMLFERYREWVIKVSLHALQACTDDKTNERLELLGAIGVLYLEQGRYYKAKQYGKQFLDKSNELLGADHPNSLTAMNNLALAFDGLERYMEAENLHRICWERRKYILGEDHPDALMSANNLAVALDNNGQYKEAKDLYNFCLERHRAVLGDDHAETLRTMNNFAASLAKKEEYLEAELLYRPCLEKRRATLGDDHPETLLTMNNFAMTLAKLEKESEAEGLYGLCLEKRRAILGDDHPEIESTMNNLYRLLERPGAIRGDYHPKALAMINNFAGIRSPDYLPQHVQQEEGEVEVSPERCDGVETGQKVQEEELSMDMVQQLRVTVDKIEESDKDANENINGEEEQNENDNEHEEHDDNATDDESEWSEGEGVTSEDDDSLFSFDFDTDDASDIGEVDMKDNYDVYSAPQIETEQTRYATSDESDDDDDSDEEESSSESEDDESGEEWTSRVRMNRQASDDNETIASISRSQASIHSRRSSHSRSSICSRSVARSRSSNKRHSTSFPRELELASDDEASWTNESYRGVGDDAPSVGSRSSVSRTSRCSVCSARSSVSRSSRCSVVSLSRGRNCRTGSLSSGAKIIQAVSPDTKSLPREIELTNEKVDGEDNSFLGKSYPRPGNDTPSEGSRSVTSRTSQCSLRSQSSWRKSPRKATFSTPLQIDHNNDTKQSQDGGRSRGSIGFGSVPREIDLSGDELEDETHANISKDTLLVTDNEIVDPYGERGVYTGALSKSTAMPNGKGRLVYEKAGRWYEGDWIHGRWTGYGRVSNGDGDLYEGGLKSDHKDGQGIMRFADGRVYEGEYIRGQMVQGKMTYQDESTYDGSWIDGMRHGRGKCTYTDGSEYEGEFREGNYHGHGKMTWNDGGWYIGEWCDGEIHGDGKEFLPNGILRHNGEWSRGQPIRATKETQRRWQQKRKKKSRKKT